MTEQTATAKRGKPWPLIAMIGVFAAPILAAWFFYLNPDYLPSARSNKGQLIQPMLTLSAASGLRAADGTAFDLAALQGKWTLVSFGTAPCAQDCRRRAHDLRQIRLALGESRFSIERLLILNGEGEPTDLGNVREELHVAYLQGDAKQALLEQLGEGEAALQRIYILDPLGNLMMRYAADAPAKDTLKDMERLLKASKNWIKGANYGHR